MWKLAGFSLIYHIYCLNYSLGMLLKHYPRRSCVLLTVKKFVSQNHSLGQMSRSLKTLLHSQGPIFPPCALPPSPSIWNQQKREFICHMLSPIGMYLDVILPNVLKSGWACKEPKSFRATVVYPNFIWIQMVIWKNLWALYLIIEWSSCMMSWCPKTAMI